MPWNYIRKQAVPVRGRRPRENTIYLKLLDVLLGEGWEFNDALQAIAGTMSRLDNILEKSARERLTRAYRLHSEVKRKIVNIVP
jgi:hypothetical protein